jgi:hypothetical protein
MKICGLSIKYTVYIYFSRECVGAECVKERRDGGRRGGVMGIGGERKGKDDD